MRQLTTLCALLLLGVVVCYDTVSIWPHTQNPHLEKDKYLLVEPAHFSIFTDSKCEVVLEAIKRYKDRFFVQDCHKLDPSFKGKYIFPHTLNHATDPHHVGALLNLTIKVSGECEKMPHMNMVEKYHIDVDKTHGAVIHGDSVWGALRGLETFSQMLINAGRDQFVVNPGKIEDFPRFSHRGFMIDTSRHYQPMKYIFQMLDGMEMNKLNVLHWHVVDEQAFPFVSETFPELSHKGAYAPDHIYTKSDVDAVIEYGRVRGIRVLVEFDTPGHTTAWGKGQPGLLTQCYGKDGKPNGQTGPIDPTMEANYDFLKKLFTEVAHRFPDQYLHLGGDEVSFECWASNPKIKEFMATHRMGVDYAKLESYYIQKVLDIVKELKKSYIVWQEVLDNNATLKQDTVVHVWIGDNWQGEMSKVVKKGYNVLLSAPWYLDLIGWGEDWVRYYETEPLSFNATDAEKKLVLGGEACLWAEFVDGSNLIAKAWPRASAFAERMWSAAYRNKASDARGRFHAQHCRMQKQGLRPGPIDGPGWCPCDGAL